MALSKTTLKRVINSVPEPDGDDVGKWVVGVCRAIEAEVRKQDDALIRQCMEALECAGAYTALIDDISLSAIQEAYKAASARLEGKP